MPVFNHAGSKALWMALCLSVSQLITSLKVQGVRLEDLGASN